MLSPPGRVVFESPAINRCICVKSALGLWLSSTLFPFVCTPSHLYLFILHLCDAADYSCLKKKKKTCSAGGAPSHRPLSRLPLFHLSLLLFLCKLKATSLAISWEGSEQRSRNYPLQNWSKQSQSGTARRTQENEIGRVCYLFELALSLRGNWTLLPVGNTKAQLMISRFIWNWTLLDTACICIIVY